jgi:hypothetical protein
MMLTCNTFNFALVLAAACNDITFALPSIRGLTGADNVELGDAGNYVILTKAGISTVPDSVITGDIAVSPAAATYITDFSLTADSSAEFSTSDQVTGEVFAANYGTPTPSLLTTAVSKMEQAYTDAAGQTPATTPLKLNYGDCDVNCVLGVDDEYGDATHPLTAGVYTYGGDVTIGANIYLDGSATDIFVIQIKGNLEQVGGTRVNLSVNAKPENVFWQVAGYAHVAEAAHMQGILLVKTDVEFKTGSSLKGRIFAQTACVLQVATIDQP